MPTARALWAVGRGRREAGDEGVDGVAPEALGVGSRWFAAQLVPPRQPLAEERELHRGLGDAAAAEQIRVGERLESLLESGERVQARGAKTGRDRRIGAVERDREERRVLEREASEDERCLDDVAGRLVGRGERFPRALEEVEGAHAEGAEQSVLGAEQAVDRSRRRAGVARHLAEGERV